MHFRTNVVGKVAKTVEVPFLRRPCDHVRLIQFQFK